jgi:hypothetical protein
MSEDEDVRTTWRMSKSLIKQLKQYALDHDTTLTAIAVEAFQEFLHRKKKDKQKLLLASNLGV